MTTYKTVFGNVNCCLDFVGLLDSSPVESDAPHWAQNSAWSLSSVPQFRQYFNTIPLSEPLAILGGKFDLKYLDCS
jgi:hypothetical protein